MSARETTSPAIRSFWRILNVNQTSLRIAMPAVALACALAAPGQADAQLTTELGGSVAFQAGIFDNDKPGEIHRAFRTDVELRLKVLGQMDNGTLYGSEIQLEVPDNTRSVISMDEAYLFIAAKWGRIELGDEDGAMSKMAIHAPSVGLGQLDGDYDQFTTESIQDVAPPFYAAASEKATKITYYTPRYLGLQVGVSYAPQIDQSNNVVAQRTDPSDFLEGGINYVTEIGDVSLLSGATVVRSRNSGTGTPPGNSVGYQVGGQAGYAGVTIGGGYTNYDGARGGIDDGFNVGASFQEGSFAVGIQYARMWTTDGRMFDGIGPGVSYVLAPGLLIGADYVHYNSELLNPPRKVQGNVLLLATRMSF
jgi:outer membrane protein OmpU